METYEATREGQVGGGRLIAPIKGVGLLSILAPGPA